MQIPIRAVAGICLLAACMSSPVRRTAPPAKGDPQPTVSLQIRNSLGSHWSLHYLQLYADGWLVWQGRPGAATSRIRPHPLPGTGELELYVRAVATRADGKGELASGREVFVVRPGRHQLLIRMSRRPLAPSSFRVALNLY